MNKNYIERKLLEKDKYYKYGEYYPFIETHHSLYSLIKNKKKRIVMLGDAGYGKSTELEVTALKYIKERNPNYVPILVKLDTYSDENIIDYIKAYIGKESEKVLNYDKNNLIFIFDEFDQVKDKTTAVRKIKLFINEYKESTFIIASRTNFYSNQFETFNIYILLPFQYKEIKEYAKKALLNQSDKFIEQISKQNIIDLVRNPFFLANIVKIFVHDNNIPNKRSDIFKRIVSLSIEKDFQKNDKHDLRQRYSEDDIINNLSYLSLIMEIIQQNYIAISDFNKIIPSENMRAIITQLTLMKKSFYKDGDVFQFQHSNIQEYLAAKVLACEKIATIKKFISVSLNIVPLKKVMSYIKLEDFGRGIRIDKIAAVIIDNILSMFMNKINPSWVNTISFLIQLREKNDLLKYLLKHAPELTLKIEKSKLKENEVEYIFKTIFEKYTTNMKVWIDRDLIDYDELADFAKTKNIFCYLLDYAKSDEHYVYRNNAIQILSRMKEYSSDSDELHSLLIRYALDESENDNVRHLSFYALARLEYNTSKTIYQLKQLKNSSNKLVRAGLYHLISKSKDIDKYLNIIFEAIPTIRTRILLNNETILADLGFSIARCIENIKSNKGLNLLIEYFINNPKDIKEFRIEKSMEIVVKNLCEAYTDHNGIYDKTKQLLITLDDKYNYEAIKELQIFFVKTQTIIKLFNEIFYDKETKRKYSLLASIANKECVYWLVERYKNNQINRDDLWTFLNMTLNRQKDQYNDFMDILNTTIGGFNPIDTVDYDKRRKDNKLNDIKIIFNKDLFKQEINKIISGIEKREIDENDIFNIRYKYENETKYSNYVIGEIDSMLDNNNKKPLTYEDMVKKIDSINYDRFIVSHIYSILQYDSSVELSYEQVKFIEQFCLKNLDKVNYKNALSGKGKDITTNIDAIWMWYFLRKYNFKYPENVLLDLLSFDWTEGHQFGGIEYLEKLIPIDIIKKRIIENMKSGIEIDQVLYNHIEFCKRYKVEDVTIIILDVITNNRYSTEIRIISVKIIASFSNYENIFEEIICNPIQGVFTSDELNVLSEIYHILLQNNNKKCIQILRNNLKLKETLLCMESAKLLIEYTNNLKAIKYFAKIILKSKEFDENTYYIRIMEKITTIKALPLLLRLLKHYYKYQHNMKDSMFSRLDNLVINILKKIALSNLINYLLVINSLKLFILLYKKKYDGVNFLNITISSFEREFLITFSKQKQSLDDAIDSAKTMIQLLV